MHHEIVKKSLVRWRTEALRRERNIQPSFSAWLKAGLQQDEFSDGVAYPDRKIKQEIAK